MFTGIVTDVGRIAKVEDRGDRRFVIATAYDPATIAIGASICCSGVCLTVVSKGENAPADQGMGWFAVDVSRETLDCTALDSWQPGTPVNLERSLRVGDELGGHIVSGHVDGVGTITQTRDEGDSRRFVFAVPDEIARYIAPKGSIAINGVSLTVNEVVDDADGTRFGVNIIPHTRSVTTFADAGPGDRVNLEIDVLARYVARLNQR